MWRMTVDRIVLGVMLALVVITMTVVLSQARHPCVMVERIEP
jgi:hypothetical protein